METPLPRTVTFQAAVVLMLWCVVRALMADAWATPLELSSLKAPLNSSFRASSFRATASRAIWPSPMAQALFPPSSDCTAVPGCMTRQSKGWPMNSSPGAMSSCSSTAMQRVGIDHACTSSAFATFIRRRPDAYGALVFLARQTFVDPQRVAAVGFSAGAWVTLSVAEPNSFEQFVPPRQLAVPGGGCVLSSMSAGSGASGDTHAHLHWGPRRLDAGGRLLQ